MFVKYVVNCCRGLIDDIYIEVILFAFAIKARHLYIYLCAMAT